MQRAAPHWQHAIDICHISTHTAGAVVSVCLGECVVCFFNGCVRVIANTLQLCMMCKIAVLSQQILYHLIICRLKICSLLGDTGQYFYYQVSYFTVDSNK